MKSIIYIIVIGITLTCFSCKPKQAATASASTDTKGPKPAPTAEISPVSGQKTVYRAIVSCTSIGAGGDARVMKDLEEYVKSFGEKGAYEMVRWGKEGERDYCFKLDKLNETEQREFVAKLKAIIGDSKLAYLAENASCQHKR